MTEGERKVLVTIPSYRRPDRLAVLLSVINEQRASKAGAIVNVLVIDNDPEGSARPAAEAAATSYVLEPARGLAAVRNRAIEEAMAAGADALIFVDDDEIPTDGWLSELIAPWIAGSAELVSGRVVSTFEPAPDPWIDAGGFFRRKEFARGELMKAAPTNNLLVDVALLARTGRRFEEAFGTTGGEDIHFTGALARAGARIVSAPQATVLDPVPRDRATRSWVMRRAYRVGTTTVAGDLAWQHSSAARLPRRVRWAAHGIARVVGGAARWALGLVTRSLVHQARGARLLSRGLGMMAGSVGIRYNEYRATPQADG
ncbi:glycosyltransferase [Microbacterium sp. 1P10UB]|uniref:glycosyltransferase family 2 protein n=1 Tax=unclassified Microbacterium TaxID=2609290 RepID=UPI0039A397A1